VGNAVTQLARALGARHAISTTTSHAKAAKAKKLGFSGLSTSRRKACAASRTVMGQT
jgi:NADPH:quinone reductase-like Zn-dependent oxidoreductase